MIRFYHDAERLAMPPCIFFPYQPIKLCLRDIHSTHIIHEELAAICLKPHFVTSQTGSVVEVGAMVRQPGMCHGLAVRGAGLGTRKRKSRGKRKPVSQP